MRKEKFHAFKSLWCIDPKIPSTDHQFQALSSVLKIFILEPFRALFGPQNSKIFSYKTPFYSILSRYATETSCKTEEFHALFFDKTWKTLFTVHSEPV